MDDRQQDKEFLAQEAYDDAAALNTREHIQEHYGSHQEPWHLWLWAHMHSRPGMSWLDLGCGPAHLWWKQAGVLPDDSQVVLTDLSPGMVQAARRNLPGASPTFSFLVADSEALPLVSGQFDAIVALGLLDHLPRLDAVLQQVSRLLHDDGFFYASAGGRRHLQELEALVRAVLPDASYGGESAAFGLENGAAQLERVFRHVALYPYEDELVFREVEPLVAYARSEAGAARRLRGERLAAFRQSLAETLSRDGAIRVTRQKGLFAAQL
jgi:ubiquinone/menaquinone biosynthesis C-methylase UbiE